MKFKKIEETASVRTDYVSEDGKVRFIKDESACKSTRFSASVQIPGAAFIAEYGATPKAALGKLKEKIQRLADELNKIAGNCGGEIIFNEKGA